MKVITDEKRIDDILNIGTKDIFVKEHLKNRLMSGKVLRVKFGIDPTGPKIHLGRAIPLRKLRQFQDLGHKVVLIVGDFTATIGDPSDKLEKRPMLTEADIKKNMKDYKNQLGKIIDLRKAEFVYNSKWLKKLGFREISKLAESFTVQQMSGRRNFKDRLDKEEEVSLREFLYPLMQGYDSVAVKSDIEIGGFDQLFNLKAGRIIQKHYDMPEQDVLTIEMLESSGYSVPSLVANGVLSNRSRMSAAYTLLRETVLSTANSSSPLRNGAKLSSIFSLSSMFKATFPYHGTMPNYYCQHILITYPFYAGVQFLQ
jgi:tyrosyl-tRNA synthetase